jgi:hypothetical protein
MIAALFVATGGVYFNTPGVDPWDESRDARNYAGPYPVVAHPPCTRWCQLAYVVQARYGHKVGDDGGCFEKALASVRAYGGVLEHPAFTIAWKTFGLPRPRRIGWAQTECGGWVCEVSQRAYGHPARKLTWLYAHGAVPPELDWSRPEPIAWVSFMVNHGQTPLPRLSKKAASATPVAFREALLSIARRVRS